MKKMLLMLGALVLCAGTALAAELVRLGVVFPMTGPAAVYGQNGIKGLKLAQENRPTVLGRPVKLMIVDNKSDKVEATNAANRVIQKDEVCALIGCLTSSNSLAAAPVAEKAKVPMLSPWATNPLVTQKKEYVFRICFIDPFQGAVAAKFARENLKAKTVALMIDISQDYSVGIAGFFQRAFTKLGGKVVLKTHYNTGDQDFSAQLGAIQAAKPDIIYVPGYFTEDALIARQARELGLTQPLLSGDAAQADELIKIGGKAVEGLYFTTHFDEQGVTTASGKHFVAAYRKAYDEAPDSVSALSYDSYNALLDAMERAKSTDAAKVSAALAQTKDFQGVTGVLTLVDHNAVKPAVILQVKNGNFAYVATVNP
ncbi:MAG: ABC transporter substrate-binding protein [Desulfarculaceae bacterium]|nr:ABC transporter substrate-binding protein [Desulfarculaceae bacterium]MCF8073887.1 ABC transporter substrate-binding protein [Desulfarculaceae bacterium]MCF8102867.1 ABC transporter substrate-binding protein [Desulfarculaceae bacterium]MCF8116311.1 ABC transporter substrate-binding protein [Desulfarculaceae bacterium]